MFAHILGTNRSLPRRASQLLPGLVSLIIAALLFAAPATSAKTTVSATYAQVGKRSLTVFVRASKASKNSRVVVQTKRFGKGRKNRARRVSKKLPKSGRLKLKISAPRGAKKIRVRVRIYSGKKSRVKGKWKTVRFSRSGRTAKLARVKRSDIENLTPPSESNSGEVTVSGKSKSRLKRGRVIALGITPATPDGMLAKVVQVTKSSGTRVATLEPASISDVVPAGQMDINFPVAPVARASSNRSSDRVKRVLDCSTSRSATATALAEVSAGLNVSAGWTGGSVWPPRVPKLTADLTGKVEARLEGSLTLDGEAKCDLAPQTLFPTPVRLAAFTVQVGPVPVPIIIDSQVTLTGSASASGSISAGVTASASASAGVKYSGGNFTPHSGFSRSFNAQPPTINGSGEAKVSLAPSVSVKMAGAAGPEFDLSGGLKLTGDLAAGPGSPWWVLTAPVSLGATFKLDLWQIHAQSPRYEMWGEEPVIAQADASTGAPGSQIVDQGLSPDPLPPGVRTRLTWDSSTDVDLHTWNQHGDHAYFSDLYAIDSGYLDQDIIPGYGPETFYETDPGAGDQFTFGVCMYNGKNANVTVDVRDPNGLTRRYTVLLRGTKAAALLTTSPPGISPYIDYSGNWCSSGDDPTALGQVTTGTF